MKLESLKIVQLPNMLNLAELVTHRMSYHYLLGNVVLQS